MAADWRRKKLTLRAIAYYELMLYGLQHHLCDGFHDHKWRTVFVHLRTVLART